MKVKLFVIFFLLFNGHLIANEAMILSEEDIVYPDDEPPSLKQIELGKKLFFDRRLSSNQQQSCASCHIPELGFGDGQKTSLGTLGDRLSRHTPHLYNLAWSYAFFWDGRASTLEEQALQPIMSPEEMNLPIPTLINRLKQVPQYVKLFTAAYDDDINEHTIASALAAYQRTLVVKDTPFDRYLAGNSAALSAEAEHGWELFKGKAGCTRCHDGPNFTDDSFHNLGVKGADIGRAKIDKNKVSYGAFKTPGLRNVALTAPYMHDGSEPSLEAVINFYNRGGNPSKNKSNLMQPLGLTGEEMRDLAAFLGALTAPVSVNRPAIP